MGNWPVLMLFFSALCQPSVSLAFFLSYQLFVLMFFQAWWFVFCNFSKRDWNNYEVALRWCWFRNFILLNHERDELNGFTIALLWRIIGFLKTVSCSSFILTAKENFAVESYCLCWLCVQIICPVPLQWIYWLAIILFSFLCPSTVLRNYVGLYYFKIVK